MHHSIRSSAGTDLIDVLVPVERQRASTGFARLHRTARMPDRTCSAGPVRLARAPRAVADAVRLLTDRRDVRAVVADAVQAGRCSLEELARELSGGPVRGSSMFRSALAEVADGIRSTAEGVRTKPALVAGQIRDALTRGLDRPPLPIRTVPAS